MKKLLCFLSVSSLCLLFIGCSSDDNNEDTVLFQKVQGKWKLTGYWTDDFNEDPNDLIVANGYEIEFKSDHTFTSNEVPGYAGGTYTAINSPGMNIKLTYKNNSGKITLYKHFNGMQGDNILYLESAVDTAYPDDLVYFAGDILTRMP